MAEEYDPNIETGKDAWNEIIDERAEAELQLRRAQREGDSVTGASAQRRISACNAELRNLTADYNAYMAQKYPPAPPQPSAEERKARSWDRMDWQDIVDMTRQSKYAKNIRPDDPDMIAGYQEAMRRRRAGE